ncbi:hypothetical protein HJC23_010026 [Cyclotella cryptica]|uniref:Cyclic nucleotide-binding domain-containing protein n=1 Tax=Cyclotella cryptica TaxID=29204 RepID=A0ABD3PSL2_9STRA
MPAERTPQTLVIFDIVIDFIFVADTFLRFYRPYSDEKTGEIVMDPVLIRTKYIGSYTFWINIIACIPIVKLWITPLLHANQHKSILGYFGILRMIRVMHLPELFYQFKKFREQKASVNEPVFRMYFILFFMLLVMCQCGSLYFGLSTMAVVEDICPHPGDFANVFLGQEMWVADDKVITNVMDTRVCGFNPDLECNDCPQMLFFTRSVYYLMQTIFTIGYGDSVVPSKSTIEMALACAFMIFGVVAYAMTIANMTSVLGNLDVVNMAFRHEMDTISRWMTSRSIPNKLTQRVFMYFSYLSRSQNGMLDEILLRELPPHLKIKLAERHIELITKVPFFRKEQRSHEFLSLISTKIKRQIFTPGAFIMYQGEMQRELIIIESGKADIHITGVPEPVGSLLPGDYVGDFQLLFGSINQVGVKGAEFTEVLVLSFEAFKEVLHKHNILDLFLSSTGSALRNCSDKGFIETIETNRQSLKKISTMANSILGGKHKNKLKKMMEDHVVLVSKDFRIEPNSRVHVYWDIIAILGILYYAIELPIRITSYHRAESLELSYDLSFLIGYFFDILFITDMILRSSVYSFSTHADGKTIIISDRHEIRRKYMNSDKFKIDLFAILPFDIISVLSGKYHILFRLPKLVRVTQIQGVLSKLQDDLNVCMGINMTETKKSILLMIVFSLLLIVWASSGWNALRLQENSIVSVYWAVTTLSTVGYGDVTPSNLVETCYALVVGAVGAVFTAAVVANVTSFFHDAEVSESNYEHKSKCLKRFMDRHKVPNHRAQILADYFEYVQEEQNGFDERLLLRHNLPYHLSTNLMVQITHPMVVECEFFSDCEEGFVRKIMVSLEQVFYIAHYTIISKDVPSDCMYFIKKGRVHLLSESSDGIIKVIRKLDTNESFAEGCLLETWESNPFLAKSATECELWILRKSVFSKLLSQFPRSRSMLKKIVTSSDDNRRRASINSVSKAAENARRRRSIYLDPNSVFMQTWFGLILTITLFSVIAVPFRVSFLENHEISITWLFVDYGGDLFLITDIILRSFFLAFYDENNHLVSKHEDIWARYVKSGKVKWHLLSAVPMEAIMIFIPVMCPLWKLQTWSFFRLNKLLRAIEIPYLIRRVEQSLNKAGVKVPKNPLKVLKLLLVIILLAHLNSCVFFTIANFNQHANNENIGRQQNWANNEGLLDSSPKCPGEAVTFVSISQQYTAALYWAMATISTVGYGDITADLNSIQEVLYSILILVVGMAVYTFVIASLEDIVSQLDVTSSLYKTKTDSVNTYAQVQCLPEQLKSKISSYYDQLWQSHLGTNGQNLLNYIPLYLKSDLISEMAKPLVDKAFYFKDCSKDFVRHLIQCLFLEIYMPDDYLYHKGERSDTLYILWSGSVDLLTSQNVKFKTVSKCILGESSFFLFEPHICSAKSSDSCEIFQLSMDAFIDSLHDYELLSDFIEYLSVNHPSLEIAKGSIQKTIDNLNSLKMVRFLDADEGTCKVPNGVVMPANKARIAWKFATFLGLVYISLSVPFRISFATEAVGIATFFFDLAIDAFFACDVYCRSCKFAIVKDGFMITSPKEFRKIYQKEEFSLDLVSILPVSTIAFFLNARGRVYGFCRLLQFLRITRFGRYLDEIVDFINTQSTFVITTASLRVSQICFTIVFLCHWCCCIFHFIGDRDHSNMTWITSDGLENDLIGRRYLRSFYWSLYTITTIGYGSVPIVTIHERVFAMITMAVGAVICDAGLTAVLASIVASKDHQAGKNSRRIQCSKLFMETNNIDENLRARILEYYVYADGEMRNINEHAILDDLSFALKCEILHFFCFESLRDSAYFEECSDGAIFSLLKVINPYLAVPDECLSVIGEECRSLFILQKGVVRRTDSTGIVGIIPEGFIIGHPATLASSLRDGMPTHELHLELLSANLPKSKNGKPYIIVKNTGSRLRSHTKSSRNWMEKMCMKVRLQSGKLKSAEIEIIVKEWRKRQNPLLIGYGRVIACISSEDKIVICSIFDDRGRNVGSIKMRTILREMSEVDKLAGHEVTTQSLGFSHLYQLCIPDILSLRQYLSRSNQRNVVERIPRLLKDTDDIEQLSPRYDCFGRTNSSDFHSSSFELPENNSDATPTKQSIVDTKRLRRPTFFREWDEN